MLIGFLAQRSRMCFVAGVRDYILVRDTELLMGMLSFLITLWILTSLLYAFNILRSGVPEYGAPAIRVSIEKIGTHSLNVGNLKMLIQKGPSGGIGLLLTSRFLYVTLIGGLGIGLVSTLAGGCVLRQHVLLAQGSMDALLFILGFYCAVVIYYGFLYRFFIRLY
jgi:uncharacterized membrane protein YedE/YeeE